MCAQKDIALQEASDPQPDRFVKTVRAPGADEDQAAFNAKLTMNARQDQAAEIQADKRMIAAAKQSLLEAQYILAKGQEIISRSHDLLAKVADSENEGCSASRQSVRKVSPRR
jgi:hypothetical protein